MQLSTGRAEGQVKILLKLKRKKGVNAKCQGTCYLAFTYSLTLDEFEQVLTIWRLRFHWAIMHLQKL